MADEESLRLDRWDRYRLHFDMLHDVERNRKYKEALRRAVGPSDVVLDVGSGSGFLVSTVSLPPRQVGQADATCFHV